MIGLGDECLRGKSQYRPRKGQKGSTKTGMSPERAIATLGQCIHHFPTRTGGYAKVIPRRTLVYRRGTEGPIPISPIVLQGY
jgi:hypothetical protein